MNAQQLFIKKIRSGLVLDFVMNVFCYDLVWCVYGDGICLSIYFMIFSSIRITSPVQMIIQALTSSNFLMTLKIWLFISF